MTEALLSTALDLHSNSDEHSADVGARAGIYKSHNGLCFHPKNRKYELLFAIHTVIIA
jgi:hypothetical protein